MSDNDISAAERESRLWKASREYMQGEIDASELEEAEQLYSLPSSEKQRTEDVLNLLLERIGDDPSKAIEDAKKFSSVSSWTTFQSSSVITQGKNYLRGMYSFLSDYTVEMVSLLQDIAQCCWGIGEIMGATVEGKIDIILILALWSNAIKRTQLSTFMKNGVLVKSSIMKIAQQNKTVEIHDSDNALIKKLVKTFSGKIVSKINGMSTTKAISGFMPVVGSLIGQGINAYIISDISRSAEVYYRYKARS